LDSKYRYTVPLATDAASATSAMVVAARPRSTRTRAAASRICSRRTSAGCRLGRRAAGGVGEVAGLGDGEVVGFGIVPPYHLDD